MHIAVIGGGAAGFFAAIAAAEHNRDAQVTIFEKSNKVLSKVKVSGGGRCNVTHDCDSRSTFAKAYPRGSKFLKKIFGQFDKSSTIQWFETRGVQLKTEADGRMFPVSDSSQSIIDCLLSEQVRLKINVRLQSPITSLSPTPSGVELNCQDEIIHADKVIVATGGSPKRVGLQWLEDLGHTIVDPVPSLFTFNIPNDPITQLMGVVAPNAAVRIQGTKLASNGPVLITHWGLSGPAVLRLSAFGARLLHDCNYAFTTQINWIDTPETEARELLQEHVSSHGKQQIGNHNPFQLPKRLWHFLIDKTALSPTTTWIELSKKDKNRLLNTILNDSYNASGKTTFKEEFVTAGGVALSDVDPSTMQSRVCANLYFAGEVLDYDGITGGFNFQGAWSTGWVAGKSV